MKTVHPIRVVPDMPEKLEFLHVLAYNLWWAWDHSAIALFREIDPDLWRSLEHNPVRLLNEVPYERLRELARDEGYLVFVQDVQERYDRYLSRAELVPTKPLPSVARSETTWFRMASTEEGIRIAYISAEFGLHECLPIYSGGLGILAGDHLKSASDLGIPLVGVGLAYRQGYLRQYLNPEGWQQERYPNNDFNTMPMQLIRGDDGQPVRVQVRIHPREVQAQVWKVQVGRIPLYLLDADIKENHPDDRRITHRLYGGNDEDRLKQEILLGIGGVRLFNALNLGITVVHLNEGHAGFASLERVREKMAENGLDRHAAFEAVTASTVFTTHTPVPAGNQTYEPTLIDTYFKDYWPQLNLDRSGFFGLGRINPFDENERFGMTPLSLRLASGRNGVSELHGEVSREMWQGIWPEVPVDEVPIRHITNGVHGPTWVSQDIGMLFDRYLGRRWVDEPGNLEVWARVLRIPAAELWRTQERNRERLVAQVRKRLQAQLAKRGAGARSVEEASEALDPDALTIGFARRFATYKRANLILRDFARFKRIFGDLDRPVQLIIAGKAHPRDEPGKGVIKDIVKRIGDPELARRVVFLEDYDIGLARYLVQGCDVWLNTPLRPQEASGTSGMKVAFSGGLNLSILDGWWVEGYQGDNGWAIGAGEEYRPEELDYQNGVESRAIYQTLEEEVIPLFYNRGSDGIPRGWVKKMQRSMATLCPVFSTNRMVIEYTNQFYLPAHDRGQHLRRDDFAAARSLGEFKSRLHRAWGGLRVEELQVDAPDTVRHGAKVRVSCRVHLGELAPEDLLVEAVTGPMRGVDEFASVDTRVIMQAVDVQPPTVVYAASVPCLTTGQMGVGVRILPRHPDIHPDERLPGLTAWG